LEIVLWHVIQLILDTPGQVMSIEKGLAFAVLFSFIPVLFWKGMLKVILGYCFI
jgi:hypothetical protein